MLGVSGLTGGTTASGDGAAATEPPAAAASAAAEAAQESGELGGAGGAGTVPGGFSEEDKARIEEGERAAGGNRWPRQETLALLQIRSDMDVAFRDSSLKGPLWEQVSRKMAEHGYHRNAKKCKEKFENVYKYHKRTKDGRSSKPDGKTYRFFDQLQALENTSSVQFPPPPRPQPPLQTTTTTMTMASPMQMQAVNNTNANPSPQIAGQLTVSSTPLNIAASGAPQNFSNLINASFPPPQGLLPPAPAAATNATNPPPQANTVPASQLNISTSFLSNSSFSSSSSTSSDEDMERRHKRKRKWKDFFERLMKDVIEKQEELQKKFLETLEKRERDRMIREEAWRVQEMARINREHDLLVQERSMAAARESALISVLQKMTHDQQQNPPNPSTTNTPPVQIHVQLPENPLPQPPPPVPTQQVAPPAPVPVAAAAPPPVQTQIMAPQPIRSVDSTPKSDNGGGENFMGTTPSRWPKAEVQALINLRTSLDNKYQESGPKGPLWEEISAGMRKLGYNRNAKRCKEKWENINKYFKKVKESNKKRPEDSKTCPYFHQLDALYKEKAKADPSYNSGGFVTAKPENAMEPIMARPEQQWPVPQVEQLQQQQQHHDQSAMDEQEGENNDHDGEDDEDDDGDEDDEDEGSGYEIVTNKPSSVAAGTTVERVSE